MLRVEVPVLETNTSTKGPTATATTSAIPFIVIPIRVLRPQSSGVVIITIEFLHELIQCQKQTKTQLVQLI